MVLQPDVRVGFPFFFGMGLLSMFAVVLAPIGLAADAARAGFLPLVLHIKPGRSVLAVVHDRVLGVLGIAVFGLPLLLQAAIFAGLQIGAVALQVVVPRVSAEGRVLKLLHRFFEAYTDQLAIGALLFRQLVLALASVLAMALLFWCLAQALGLAMAAFPLLLAVTPGLYLAHSLPFTYAGWGAREAAAIALLTPVAGIAPAEAVALSFAYGAILTVAALPGAVVPLFLSWGRGGAVGKVGGDEAG